MSSDNSAKASSDSSSNSDSLSSGMDAGKDRMTPDLARQIIRLNIHLNAGKPIDSDEYRTAYRLATAAGDHRWSNRVEQAKGFLEGVAYQEEKAKVMVEALEILLPMALDLQRNFPSGTGRENIEIAQEALAKLSALMGEK